MGEGPRVERRDGRSQREGVSQRPRQIRDSDSGDAADPHRQPSGADEGRCRTGGIALADALTDDGLRGE